MLGLVFQGGNGTYLEHPKCGSGVILVLCNKALPTFEASHEITHCGHGPTAIIDHRVAKHIEKEGLGEGVEVGQGLAALGSEGFGLVQDGGDAALLFQRWQWDFQFTQLSQAQV